MSDGALATLAKRYVTSPRNNPQMSATMAMPILRKQGKTNAQALRRWAQNATWPRVAIDIRRSQISSAEWDIVPYDPSQPYPKRLRRQIRRLFEEPNDRDRSFAAFIDPVIEDLHVLDAGVIENERTGRKVIAQIWPVDGAEIYVDRFWDGTNPNAPRYFWRPDGWRDEATLLNQDLVYMMLRPSTHRAVGLSSMEILKETIDADLSSFDYNKRQVSTAGGEGIFDLGEDATPNQVTRFRSYWFSEVAGRAAIAFWGGTRNAKWISTQRNNREAQFMEWNLYLAKRSAAVFQLSSQDFGLTESINKATGEVLQDLSEDRGARTQFTRVQDYITREIVWDAGFGGRDNNLAFRFTKLNLRQTLSQAQIEKIELAGMPTMAVDEIRMAKGLEPWGPPFDRPMIVTPQGAVSLDDVPTAADSAGAGGDAQQGAQAKLEELAWDSATPAEFLAKLERWREEQDAD